MNRLLILILLLAMSCQDDDTPSESLSPTGLIKDNLLESNGIERAYHLFIPENYTNKPVVIILHGNGGSHDDILGFTNVKSPHKIWLSIAEQNEFIVVVPNGTLGDNDRRGWNDCRMDSSGQTSADDVTFIVDLLNSIKEEYDFDEDKVYIAGTSNGGHMAIRLAQDLAERITAFASIVSSMPENSTCTNSSTPISALFMNGTEDPLLPYEGGEMASNRGTVLSTQESIDYWITRNGTSNIPEIEDIPNTCLLYTSPSPRD